MASKTLVSQRHPTLWAIWETTLGVSCSLVVQCATTSYRSDKIKTPMEKEFKCRWFPSPSHVCLVKFNWDYVFHEYRLWIYVSKVKSDLREVKHNRISRVVSGDLLHILVCASTFTPLIKVRLVDTRKGSMTVTWVFCHWRIPYVMFFSCYNRLHHQT